VLVRLRYLQRNLEELARVRAVALSHEIAERERLEREMLEISEREQRRIGQDLHDGLCQHLTGTALAGQLLAEKLTRRELPEPREARKVVDLIEEAITLARGMAKGLHPVEMKSDGLMQALEEFCVSTSELFESQSTAIHLYRIAQEGVGNAIKHGRPTRIVVQLEEIEEGTQLMISDNGSGLPASAPPGNSIGGNGMGLRIIADRAKMIGGHFRVDRGRFGGAELSCLIPHQQAAQ
jgi:signal transduction histidine kinase